MAGEGLTPFSTRCKEPLEGHDGRLPAPPILTPAKSSVKNAESSHDLHEIFTLFVTLLATVGYAILAAQPPVDTLTEVMVRYSCRYDDFGGRTDNVKRTLQSAACRLHCFRQGRLLALTAHHR